MVRVSDDFRQPRRTTNMTGVSSANSGHCATICGAVRTGRELYGHDQHCKRRCATKSLYSPLCRTLGRHGQRPSNMVQLLTRTRPPSTNTLGAPPGQMQRMARPAAIATPPTSATGQGHIPGMVKGLKGRRPRPTPCFTVFGNRSYQLFSPDSGRDDDIKDHSCM